MQIFSVICQDSYSKVKSNITINVFVGLKMQCYILSSSLKKNLEFPVLHPGSAAFLTGVQADPWICFCLGRTELRLQLLRCEQSESKQLCAPLNSRVKTESPGGPRRSGSRCVLAFPRLTPAGHNGRNLSGLRWRH